MTDNPPSLEEYQRHLSGKEDRIRRLLGGIRCSPEFTGLVPCPIEGGFRTRAKFALEASGDDIRIDGFDPRTGRVPWRDSLWMLGSRGRDVMHSLVPILERRQGGGITGLELRLEHGGQGCHLALSVRRDDSEFDAAIVTEIIGSVPSVSGVSVPARRIESGVQVLIHCIGEVCLEADPRAFFQSNSRLLPRLVEHVVSSMPSGALADIYCGVGLFSLTTSDKGRVIAGIDSNGRAVECARRNADALGFVNATFRRGAAEGDFLETEIAEGSAILLNPSRLGCAEDLPPRVVGRRPKRVLLVSCSIDSHVQDLSRFAALGWRASQITAFDMFPFSEFVEIVTVLAP